MQNKQFYRIKEIAFELGVSKATVYNWMDEGKIPRVYKRGKRYAGYPNELMQQVKEMVKPVQT